MKGSNLTSVTAVAIPVAKGAVIGVAIIALAIVGVDRTVVSSKVGTTIKNPISTFSFRAGYSTDASKMKNFKKAVDMKLTSLRVKPQTKVTFAAFKAAVKKQQLSLAKFAVK